MNLIARNTRADKYVYLLATLILGITVLLGACSSGEPNAEATDAQPTMLENTPTPGELAPTIESVPDPNETTSAYLDAWANFDYETMYNMLTTLSKDSITYEDFEVRYRNVATQAVLVDVDYEILQNIITPTQAQVAYKSVMYSSLVGSLETQTQMDLHLEDGVWKVVWNETLILPELAGGNRLSMETIWPTRGIIYDKDGNTLSADTTAMALSVIPSEIDDDQGDQILSIMQAVSGINTGYWDMRIFTDNPPYILPLYEIPYSIFEQFQGRLERNYNAMGVVEYNTRLSYIGEAGGHSVGWVGAIPAESVQTWADKGYPASAQIGRSGLEAWAEEMLAGKPSADLYVVTPDNLILSRLASRDTVPSQSVYSTLDDQLQLWAQLSLQGFKGAVVVLERDTGRVLAIASSPSYNPNYGDYNNPNTLWDNYFPDTEGYFFNRATQGQYPPGSIFKVITASAALESGRYSPTDVLECGYYWYGPDNSEFVDWTLEKERPASGNLTLVEGLMRSCNIWFYEIGYKLYTNDFETAVADMARGFGLGQPTGIDVFVEEDGQITDPNEQGGGGTPWGNAVMQGIGQSDTLITPLQAAVYTAAIGNGGTLFRPQMIERVENTAGDATFEFTPVVNGTLPISDTTLAAVREGMLLVTQNSRGTAYNTFVNRPIRVYGKTGTAQAGDAVGLLPHAWFIGFTDEQDENRPDIAIAVIVENQGDGSEFAAPIFRRLMEVYFYDQPTSVFPWENRIGEIDERYFMTDEELEALEEQENNNDNNN